VIAQAPRPGDVWGGLGAPFPGQARRRPQRARAPEVTYALLPVGPAQCYDKQYNDVFNFLIDDAKKILGRVPFNGDLIERFDGKILEIVKSVETQAETWEWIYQTCSAINTNKDNRSFFRSQET
jgi:hypothetical protein